MFRLLRPNATRVGRSGGNRWRLADEKTFRRNRLATSSTKLSPFLEKLAMTHTANFHALVAFMIISSCWGTSREGGRPWPRHFLLRRRKIQEKIGHSAVGAAAGTIMEENIDLIFSLRRAAFLFFLHLSRRGPGHGGKHLFTVRNFRKNTHTHTKHATQIHRIHFLRAANQHFPHSIGHERGQQRRKTPFRGTVPLFFRGHCSE